MMVIFQHAKQFFYGIVNWEELAPKTKRVDLEMEPGDTVFFSSALVHGSRANVSKVTYGVYFYRLG